MSNRHVAVGPQCVKRDVHPFHAGGAQRNGKAGQRCAVGGHGHMGTRMQRHQPGDKAGQTRPDRGLTASQSDLGHPKSGDRYPNETDDLLVGQSLLPRQPRQAFGGHAVGAPQITAVGQRNPQIGGDPTEGVPQCHLPSLERPAIGDAA